MTQAIGKQKFANTSLRRSRSARTVLLQMAADEARADRIRQLKADHPELTWRAIADHVGVSERAAVDWQKTGGIEYENAKKLAQLFPEVTLDYLWRGEAPDLLGTMNNGVPEDLQAQLDDLRASNQEVLRAIEDLKQLVLPVIALLEPGPEEEDDASGEEPAASEKRAAAS